MDRPVAWLRKCAGYAFVYRQLVAPSAFSQNPGGFALTTPFIAVGIAMIAGWLGGELVDRLGVGVDEGTNLSAPSSFNGKPAGQPDDRRSERAA